jgi:SAM-dependent methyltransferase
MTDTTQHALWNGPAGDAWVQAQPVLDDMFAPFVDHLAQGVPPGSPWNVLDVGCGTGAVSLAIAARLGAGGHCTGLDISAAMIAMARERARSTAHPVDFIAADAQRHAFAPAAVDHVVSRFGVMFFDDPVGAFTGLRVATRSGGTLHALTWRAPDENAFMTTAERAAAPLLALPPRSADGPGQFAFADRQRVLDILADSGWRDIEVTAVDQVCSIRTADLQRYVSLLGPVGGMLRDPRIDAALRAQVLQVVVDAFAPFVQGDRVAFVAACWALRAVAP